MLLMYDGTAVFPSSLRWGGRFNDRYGDLDFDHDQCPPDASYWTNLLVSLASTSALFGVPDILPLSLKIINA